MELRQKTVYIPSRYKFSTSSRRANRRIGRRIIRLTDNPSWRITRLWYKFGQCMIFRQPSRVVFSKARRNSTGNHLDQETSLLLLNSRRRKQPFLVAAHDHSWGRFAKGTVSRSSRNVPQRRWASRNVCFRRLVELGTYYSVRPNTLQRDCCKPVGTINSEVLWNLWVVLSLVYTTENFWHGLGEIGTGAKKELGKLCLHYTWPFLPQQKYRAKIFWPA